MLIELVKKNTTKTSRGILSKAWYKIDGRLCLSKRQLCRSEWGNRARTLF